MRAPIALVVGILFAAASIVATPSVAPQEIPEIPELPDVNLDELRAIVDFELPADEEVLQIHLDFPEDDPLEVDGVDFYSLTINVYPDGSVETVNAVSQPATTGSSRGKGCRDGSFKRTGISWDKSDLPIRWYFAKRTVPAYMKAAKVLDRLKRAHWAWPQEITDCTSGAANDFTYRFATRSPKGVARDGINQVLWKSFDGAVLALNYAWFSGTDILEVDLAFNAAYRWTTNPRGRKRFRVREVATHELGHQLGLDDLADPHGGLTMYGRIGRGEGSKTTLGRGDLRGARTLYAP